MKEKNKKITVLLLSLGGFLLNHLLNLIIDILLSRLSSQVYSYESFLDIYVILSLISNIVPFGTLAASLIGGSVPGMITALLTGVSALMLGDTFYSLATNILFAMFYVFIRNKRLLERKRNVPVIALILTLTGYFLFAFFESAYIPALIISFLLYMAELFICRSIIPKFENLFPIKEASTDKIYRNHSIKRDILLLMNISAICLSGVFVIFGAMKYYESFSERASQYADICNSIIREDNTDKIIALRTENDLEKFDDTAISDMVSAMPADDLYISKIIFYTFDALQYGNDIKCIGYIEYDYSDDHIVTDRKIYNTVYDEKGHYINNSYMYECGNDNYVIVEFSVGCWEDYYTSMLQYIFALIIISASIIFFANVFAVRLMDKHIVIPINSMTSAAARFAYDTDEHRAFAMEEFCSLAISSGDEVETLYNALSKTMGDMNDHISHIKEQAKHISDMQHNIILTMADIVESRDENTGGHIRRTAEYVRIIAETLRENGQYSDILTNGYIEDMIVAAPLHDMGKIHVSDSILNKPGKLDDEEFDIMKSHTTAGRELLRNATKTLGSFSYLDMAVQMAAYHHEKWNGKGYPEGISGDDIPLCARIMAVADVFDALVSKRCYKEPMPLEKAYSIIREDAGTAFDPVVVDAFLAASDKIEYAMNSFR